MDIYRFINSRDIRKYLKDIKYDFNSLEASWLVHQCIDAGFDEKHRAWTWILENMPDMEVIKRPNCKYRESLHKTLREYMDMEDKFLEMFLNPINAIYVCEYIFYGDYEGDKKAFFTLDECKESAKEVCSAYYEEERGGFEFIVTGYFKDKDYEISVLYDADENIKRVHVNKGSLYKSYEDLLYFFFDGMWFNFPTPFKKGDIVYNVARNPDPDDHYKWDFCRGVMVLEGLITWYLEEKGPMSLNTYIDGRNGDTTDMTVYGYFMYYDYGTIYRECCHTYMDLEYYRGPLTEVKRLFKALSRYMKGEISLELLLYANRMITTEKWRENLSEDLYDKEQLKLAGLLEEETAQPD